MDLDLIDATGDLDLCLDSLSLDLDLLVWVEDLPLLAAAMSAWAPLLD